MKSFYLTDTGRVRSHNEDSVTIVKNASNEHLMIVADGMGGHRAGEIASSMVVTQIGKRFAEIPTIGTKLDAVKWLKENIDEVNNSILKYGEENPDSSGLGTTVVMALLTKEFLMFVNIGDSSGYVLKNQKLHKITKEHTLVNFLVETGEITKEEAINHPKKNVLMKALGVSEKLDADIFDVDPNIDAIMPRDRAVRVSHFGNLDPSDTSEGDPGTRIFLSLGHLYDSEQHGFMPMEVNPKNSQRHWKYHHSPL